MKINNLSSNASIRYKQELDNERSKRDLVDERLEQNLAHQRLLRKEAQSYDHAIRQMTKEHQAKLLGKEQQFFKEYRDLAENQVETLNQMRQNGQEELAKLASRYALSKESISEKAQDSFYSISTLSPYVEKLDGEYHIYLDVPEHEKDNISITIEGRKIRLNMSRYYAESILNKDTKSINQSTKRSELITQEIHVPDLLDPKTVTKQYEDGQILFRVLIA